MSDLSNPVFYEDPHERLICLFYPNFARFITQHPHPDFEWITIDEIDILYKDIQKRRDAIQQQWDQLQKQWEQFQQQQQVAEFLEHIQHLLEEYHQDC